MGIVLEPVQHLHGAQGAQPNSPTSRGGEIRTARGCRLVVLGLSWKSDWARALWSWHRARRAARSRSKASGRLRLQLLVFSPQLLALGLQLLLPQRAANAPEPHHIWCGRRGLEGDTAGTTSAWAGGLATSKTEPPGGRAIDAINSRLRLWRGPRWAAQAHHGVWHWQCWRVRCRRWRRCWWCAGGGHHAYTYLFMPINT